MKSVVLVLCLIVLSLVAACNDTGPMGPPGQSIVGPQGATGTTGSPGPQGSPGVNGTDGTSPSIVQFCAGTTTYPSTFCEIGFCFNNVLYATYSVNDGFSTEIAAGDYSSAGVNCSCNFTVTEGCSIAN